MDCTIEVLNYPCMDFRPFASLANVFSVRQVREAWLSVTVRLLSPLPLHHLVMDLCETTNNLHLLQAWDLVTSKQLPSACNPPLQSERATPKSRLFWVNQIVIFHHKRAPEVIRNSITTCRLRPRSMAFRAAISGHFIIPEAVSRADS